MEHQTNTPDRVTPETEKEVPGRYESFATSSIEHANEAKDAEGRLDVMRDFLKEIRLDAYGGEIKGTSDYDAEKFDTLLFTFSEEIQRPVADREEKFKDPLKIIPRHEGLRDGFVKLMTTESTAQALLDAIAEVKAKNLEAEREHDRIFKERYGEHELSPVERSEVIKEIGEEAVENVLEQQQTETELQMNERFLRESEEELKELYARHRATPQGSSEADALESQIRYTKEDVGKFAKNISKLKDGPNSVWH